MKNKSWFFIAKREILSYFTSPIAYIVSALFLLFSGFLFFSTFFLVNRAELRSFFELLPILFSFFIPAMTMRVFSEEKKSGTMETLVTLPVSIFDIVLGKYLACFVCGVVLLVPTLFYIIACVLFASASVDFGPIIGGYIGAILLIASFCAIGVFASSMTKNQIIAFFVAWAICIFLTLVNSFSVLLPSSFIAFATFISSSSHFMSIARGIIDSRDILYFISITAIFISLTTRIILNSRKG